MSNSITGEYHGVAQQLPSPLRSVLCGGKKTGDDQAVKQIIVKKIQELGRIRQ